MTHLNRLAIDSFDACLIGTAGSADPAIGGACRHGTLVESSMPTSTLAFGISGFNIGISARRSWPSHKATLVVAAYCSTTKH